MAHLCDRPGELAVAVPAGWLPQWLPSESLPRFVIVIEMSDDKVMYLNHAGVCVASKSQVRLWRLKRSK